MRKVVHLLVFVAAIAGLMIATSADTPAPAQEKAKVEAGGQGDVGTIEVYTDKGGKWRYRAKLDGKVIAMGPVGYTKKEDLMKVLDSVKATMAKGKVVEVEPEKK